ncbi:glycosyltransferase [Paraburkholderia sp. CNPSo 3157]|uniref:Glycosyltransferase n=1 Tax=Paraburkholderia franconis TaxID=2654983 RepID=A0A7X1N8P0_9BURK|nr:glycosyltransferase family 4 protein [Paraburkholderia franconis]MPW17420.1 glycosyltransferase [Paraburkholderia franconis]
MKVLMLVNSMGNGGAERVAATLVNSWARRGDAVTLVATFTGHGACAYPVSDRVRFVYLADLIVRSGRGPVAYLERFRALRRVIRSSAPDVIVSLLPNVNIAAIVSSRGLGIPIIACEHNNPVAEGRSSLWRLLCGAVYPLADVVTMLTESAVAPFAAMVKAKRFAVVPNPLPDDLPFPSEPRTCVSTRKRLMSVGRLCHQKQFDLLIAVFSRLADEFPDWDLWIWGEGPDRQKLEAQIADLRLRDRILLPGTTQTLWFEMMHAHAFALSSRHEGLPMALMEGMALGLPAVAFDCPSGPRELMRDGQDGLLVPMGDVEAFTRAVRHMLSDEVLRIEMGRRAERSIRERYSLETILAQWDELFAQVGVPGVGKVRAGSSLAGQ